MNSIVQSLYPIKELRNFYVGKNFVDSMYGFVIDKYQVSAYFRQIMQQMIAKDVKIDDLKIFKNSVGKALSFFDDTMFRL